MTCLIESINEEVGVATEHPCDMKTNLRLNQLKRLADDFPNVATGLVIDLGLNNPWQ